MAIIPQRNQNANGSTTADRAFEFSLVECRRRFFIAKVFKPDWDEVFPEKRPATFLSRHKKLELIEDFAKALEWLSTQPRMGIIPGRLIQGFTGWQRRTLDPFNKYNNPVTIEAVPLNWIMFDLDGARVPYGLGEPDKVAEAGYYFRDKQFPPYFRGIRCVATSTARTGIEPDIARIRLYFLLSETMDLDAILAWLSTLKYKRPDLCIDPSVMDPNHITYTARPIFDGWSDPVPEWGRVRILDGYEDFVTLDMTNVKPRKRNHSGQSFHRASMDIPKELLLALEEDAGLGAGELHYELTEKGRKAIHRAFDMLDGCPKGNDRGRHREMLEVGFELVGLHLEQEFTKRVAMRTFLTAAKNIKRTVNGRTYTDADIKDHMRTAFDKKLGS
jgi:hypothetical protein